VLQGILDTLVKAGTLNAMKENKVIRISKENDHPQYRLCKIKSNRRMWNVSTIWVA
jgi:hypothetical protein